MEPQRISVTASALTSDARAAPRLARQAGFGGLVFNAYSAALNLPELSTSGRREFRAMLASERQVLVAIRCDVSGAKGLGPGADVERELSRLDRATEVARELAAGCMCVDLGPLPPAPVVEAPKPTVTPEQAGLILLPTTTAPAAPPAPPAPPPDPAAVSQVHAALVELCSRAERYGVKLALSSSLSSFASLHHAMSGTACPWFGVDFDPVAVLRDDWDVDEVFSALGPLVRHVRARDAVAGADRRTRPTVVGRGAVDWPRLVASLDDAGYRGFVTVDPTELSDRAAAALAARTFLSGL